MTDITDLPAQLTVLTRDQHRDRYTRSYKLRNPNADVGSGTQPFLDASSHADSCVPLYADARLVGDATNVRTARGTWLDAKLEAEGLERDPAVGSSGFVTITTSVGGATIYVDDELSHLASGLRFRVLATALYTNGQQVPVVGIDTGPTTNLPAGTILDWSSPRAGCASRATVFLEGDGTGLSGGHPDETDQECQDKIIDARQNPPAAGNDAEYHRVIRQTPGVAVEQPFTHPGIRGGGTSAFVFTLRPSSPGASRVPNGAQIGLALAALQTSEAVDDGIFAAVITETPVAVALRATWSRRSPTWADVMPWPAYVAGLTSVVALPAPTATTFRIESALSQVAPVVGQTIALFNRDTLRFVRKRIAAVVTHSVGLSWDITCDASNAASDTSYVPYKEQIVSPWSDSLQAIVAPVVAYFDGLGPGEQIDPLPDPNGRQRRQPEAPEYWPHTLTNRITDDLFGVTAVSDIEVASPALPHAPAVGTPGVLSHLLTLGDLAVYPQAP